MARCDAVPAAAAARRPCRLQGKNQGTVARRWALPVEARRSGVAGVDRAAGVPTTARAVARLEAPRWRAVRRRTLGAGYPRLSVRRERLAPARRAPRQGRPRLAVRLLARLATDFSPARSQSQVLLLERERRRRKRDQAQSPRDALPDDSTHFARQIDPQPNAMLRGGRSQDTSATILERCWPIWNCRPRVSAQRSRRSVRWTVARQEARHSRHPHSGRVGIRTRCGSPRSLASAQEREPRSRRTRTTRPASAEKIQ